MDEIIYTIPLREAFNAPRTRRSNKAVRIVREFIRKHSKARDVRLDASVNEALWRRGIGKPPRRIRVKITKEDEVATATLVE